MNLSDTIYIGKIAVSPPLALAPMVGLSHSALRTVVSDLGGVGLFYTEMLSAKRLPNENATISPCLVRTPAENPLFYQIFLNDQDHVAPALTKLSELEADGVDLNFGCPAPKLRRFGAGCVLAEKHDMVRKIITKMRRFTKLPISAKIRLGENLRNKKYIELCRILEGEGVDCITIHARLNCEKFCRKPRWEWIAEAKDSVGIPVLANGGIFSVEDARKCLAVSGADGLMLGRGAVTAPWLFSEIASAIYGVGKVNSLVSLAEIYQQFASLLTKRFNEERRLGRLKQFTHYFAASYSFGHQLAHSVQTSLSMEEALQRAHSFFNNNEPLIVSGG